MNAREVIEEALACGVLITLDGERVILESVTLDTPPSDVVDLCRAHKPDLLRALRFQEEANALLLASTRRLARLWKAAATVFEGDSAWTALEDQLHAAYWGEDLEALRGVLSRRERYATECWRVTQ